MSNKEWFVKQFDEFVAKSLAEGSEVEKSRDAVAHAYADAVEGKKIKRYTTDLVSEGRALFDQMVSPVRSSRRSSMLRTNEDLLDAIHGDAMYGQNDPLLDVSYGLGDGRDKTLRMWTPDDWRAAAIERFRNAAQATAAASAFDATVTDIVAEMSKARAKTVGELFGDVEASAFG